jgi:hypothetical protein
MAYIGNNTDYSSIRFNEIKAISIDKSAIQTVYLDGGENGVNDSPTDVMGVSLEQVKADCNNKGFLIIDFGSIEDTVGIVDFGYI